MSYLHFEDSFDHGHDSQLTSEYHFRITINKNISFVRTIDQYSRQVLGNNNTKWLYPKHHYPENVTFKLDADLLSKFWNVENCKHFYVRFQINAKHLSQKSISRICISITIKLQLVCPVTTKCIIMQTFHGLFNTFSITLFSVKMSQL